MRKTKEEAMQTRASVLDAASQIITRHGISSFTIESVAQEAGLTKGGVLHHFASKEDLINALIEQVIQAYQTRLAQELEVEPADQPGHWLRAYIRTVFSMQYEDKNLIPALAAALSSEHQIMDRVRISFRETQRAAVQDGIDPVQAMIIRLAVDGVVFARALNLDVMDKETSQKVYDELFRLTGSTGVKA
ncbi:MAG: TetR family transcriptional regulator [Anaerolineaceae bacterium]|nr:TetR family transcriptional regulator [Anaerolineaceae bacterium]